MAVLVIADHDNAHLKPGVANAITAAARMGGEITVLVAGHQCGAMAQAAAKLAGVKKVLHCDAPHYQGFLAENLAALISEICCTSSSAATRGITFLPRPVAGATTCV